MANQSTNNKKYLERKFAFVTIGSRGIGRGIAVFVDYSRLILLLPVLLNHQHEQLTNFNQNFHQVFVFRQ